MAKSDEIVPDELYDDDDGPHIFQPPPEPTNLDYFLRNLMAYFSNPWMLLLLAILTYKIWQRIKPTIIERYYGWQERRKEGEYAARYHKNPDEFRHKTEAMDDARAEMQKRYDRDAVSWAEKLKEKEERKILKRKQDLEDWENLRPPGYKNEEKGEKVKQRTMVYTELQLE